MIIIKNDALIPRGSLEGAFTIFSSLEAFFWGVLFKRELFFASSNGLAYFDVKKSSVAENKK